MLKEIKLAKEQIQFLHRHNRAKDLELQQTTAKKPKTTNIANLVEMAIVSHATKLNYQPRGTRPKNQLIRTDTTAYAL